MDKINRIRNLIRDGASVSAISREVGVSRNTIYKYGRIGIPKIKNPLPEPRCTKSDPYVEKIRQIFLQHQSNTNPKDRLTAKRIFDLLAQEAQQAGEALPMSLRTVERLVKKIRPDRNTESAMKLIHHAGEAQVDFGEMRIIRNGKLEKALLLILTLPYSNSKFARLLPAQNSENLRYGLFSIFKELKGVPPVIRFDNMSTAVSEVLTRSKLPEDLENVHDICGNPRRLTESFCRFMNGCGFHAQFCKPAGGNEKGSVENAVGWFRHNFFVPTRILGTGYEEFNDKELTPFCSKQRRNLHYKKKVPIEELYAQERQSFLPLPEELDVELGSWLQRSVNKSGMIEFDKHSYQVAASPEETIAVYVRWDTLEFYVRRLEGKKCLGQAPRLYENDKDFIDWSIELKNLSRKGMSFKGSMLRSIMDKSASSYCDRLPVEDRRSLFTAMLALLDRKSNDIQSVLNRLNRILVLYGDRGIEDLICALRGSGETPTDAMRLLSLGNPELEQGVGPVDLNIYAMEKENGRTTYH